MAHKKLGTYKLELSKDSIQSVIESLEKSEEELLQKCDEFCKRVAEEGVLHARLEIESLNAVDTGNLYNSMDLKPGDVISNGSSWIIYTNCEYAEYVEFGTGTKGQEKPHPSGLGKYNQDMSNKVRNPYNKNDHRLGWFYGSTWTSGMPSRPFMYNTWNYLKQDKVIRQIAKEVFG